MIEPNTSWRYRSAEVFVEVVCQLAFIGLVVLMVRGCAL